MSIYFETCWQDIKTKKKFISHLDMIFENLIEIFERTVNFNCEQYTKTNNILNKENKF